MNKPKLIELLQAEIAKDHPQEQKIFLRLIEQVWQIDWTVAAYDILSHYLTFDIPYFYRFMQMDIGDEDVEMQLLKDWVDARVSLKAEAKKGLVELVDTVNQLRIQARQEPVA